VVELATGAQYVFTAGCTGLHKLILTMSNQAVQSGLPQEVDKKYESRSACSAAVDVLNSSRADNPVKIVLDPVRALSNPDDYLTIE
jgi:hypothetical protein